MKRIVTQLTLVAAMTCSAANADPYCADLISQDQLPKKYQKRGPFYSDVATGWIVGQDQFKNKYDVSAEAEILWRGITAEFDKHGVELVVLAAPPRPLFAPQSAIDAMDLPADVKMSDLDDGFSAYIAALNAAGITAPDLSTIAADASSADYYFARDTHWTPMGAGVSVAHLNAAMGRASVSDSMARIDGSATYEEKGSLAGVVKDVCGARPDIETVPAPQYAEQGSATSLLGDAPELDKIALVGTSFSDRYQSDAYQVAGALAFVMGASVDNFAVTGGGLVGSIEAFVRSGALANGDYKTVVWETPYSAPLTHVDGLRQVLGALQTNDEQVPADTLDTRIGKDWINIDHSFPVTDVRRLEIETEHTNTGHLVVELIDAKGGKTRTKLVKTDRVSADLRHTKWAVALDDVPEGQIVRIKLRLPKAKSQEVAIVRFFD